MKKNYASLKLFLVLIFLLYSTTSNAQSPCGGSDLCVVQFNAGFNEANKVEWVDKLTDCKKSFIDIQTNTEAAGKYKIVVVPTIVIYKGGEEVHRYQANIMMVMEATKKEVQGKVDEIIMSDF